MDAPTPQNPYSETSGGMVYATPVSTGRLYPTMLRLFAIITLLLSITGGVTGLWAIVANSLGIVGNQPSTINQDAEVQARLQQQMQVVTSKYRLGNIIFSVLQVACCVLLITGAFWILFTRPGSAKLFIAACLAVIPFEIARGVFTGFVMSDTWNVMREMQDELFQMPEGAQQPPGFAETTITVMIVMMSIFAFGWIFAKVVFYLAAATYVAKPSTRDFLAERARA